MRRPARILFVASLLFTAGTAGAADTSIPLSAVKTAEQLRDKALSDGTAYALLQSLTTEIGPRLAGGTNDQRARDWALAKFKALGFDNVYTEPATYPLWVRRHESGAIVSPFPQRLVLTALGYSPATPKGGLIAPVVAFDSLAALKAADPTTVKGKIVYIGYRMQRSRDGHDYGIGAGIRENGPLVAAGKGAVAFILRSAGTDAHERIAHTGVTGFEHPGAGVPSAALSNPDADQLERELAYGKPVTVRLDLDCGIVGQYTGANVIGEITGKKYPNQVVAIGGHLDSWDPGTGAIDDGAGIAISMAAAKLIHDLPQRPDRTIRVIAFANEEMGLWGANAYADRHAREVADFMLGTDSDLGAGKVYRMSASVKPSARRAIEQIAAVLKPLGVDYDASRPGGGGSDLGAMRTKGMAALTLDQDATYYFDWHHTSNDTLDKVDPKELAQNVAAYAAWAYMAAQADGDFGSAPGAFAKDGSGE